MTKQFNLIAIKIALFLLIFINQQFAFGQSFNAGPVLSLGYNINTPVGDEQMLYDQRFDNSKTISSGFFVNYILFKKISVHSALLAGIEKLNYNYRNTFADTVSQFIDFGNGQDIHMLNNKKIEKRSIFFLKMPIELRLSLFKNTSILGGVAARYSISNALKDPFETYSIFGIESVIQNIRIKLFFEGSINNRKIQVEENIFTKLNSSIVPQFSSRSINFSLSYNLWRK
jgi:hypothetical protein